MELMNIPAHRIRKFTLDDKLLKQVPIRMAGYKLKETGSMDITSAITKMIQYINKACIRMATMFLTIWLLMI